MNRDTLKTLAGLLIIGVIVVATFMYGNAQRKAQLKHDQEVKQQQAAKSSPTRSPLPTATSSAQPTAGGTASNTAPVQSPASSGVQGGSTATPKPATPAPATPAPTPTPAVAATNNNGLPQTGPETAGAIGAFGILGAMYLLRRSKKSLYTSLRSPRS